MVEQETLPSLSQETQQQQQLPEPEEQTQIHQLKHEEEEEEVLPDQNDSITAHDPLEQLDTSFEDRREEEEDLNTKQRRKRKGIPIKVRELQGPPLTACPHCPAPILRPTKSGCIELCGYVHIEHRQTPTQISIGFCANLSVSVSVSVYPGVD